MLEKPARGKQSNLFDPFISSKEKKSFLNTVSVLLDFEIWVHQYNDTQNNDILHTDTQHKDMLMSWYLHLALGKKV